VCKDLGKTIDEIKVMSKVLIKWHYLNAVHHKEEKINQKNEELKFMMALIRPELYQKLEKEHTVIQTTSIPTIVDEKGIKQFDIDYERFKQLTERQEQILSNVHNEVVENEDLNPVSLEISE
jgi:hypothetical protein